MGMGRRGRRTRRKKAAAAVAEEEGMKKLYVFLDHGRSDGKVHSLYVLDIPVHAVEFHNPTTTTTTTTVTSTGTRTTKLTVTREEPTRVPISPVLLFDDRHWPRNMNCVRLDSRLFFLGGRFDVYYYGVSARYSYPSKVFVLDLSSQLPSSSSPMEVLKRAPSMRTGKVLSISFVVDGKIFVLSGRNRCTETAGIELNQFEIFSPLTGEWSNGKPPPFTDSTVGPYVIVNRQVIVFASGREESKFYSYDLDGNAWSEFDTRGWTKVYGYPLPIGNGSQLIGDTIYAAVPGRRGGTCVIPVKKFDNYAGEDDLRLDDDKFFDVVKYTIPTHHASGTLAHIADGDRDGHMCFVQVGYLKEGCGVSVAMFNLFGDRGSPAHLNSTHYLIPHPRCFYNVGTAYMV